MLYRARLSMFSLSGRIVGNAAPIRRRSALTGRLVEVRDDQGISDNVTDLGEAGSCEAAGYSGDYTVRTRASIVKAARAWRHSKRLDHDQNHDADHQNGRHLVGDPVDARRMQVQPGGEALAPARIDVVHHRQAGDEHELGVDPAAAPV